jgi:hypothetical protein
MSENPEEHRPAAGGHHHGGEHQHHHPHPEHDLAGQIEEKLEHVAEEVKEIEALIQEENLERQHDHHHHPEKFFVEIEGIEYPWNSPTITVPDIRRLGNLPADQPVIEIDQCNQERTLTENEVIHLKPGHRYGKKVRFKRGLDRMTAELDLLRRYYPTAEWHPSGAGGWIRIPGYKFPPTWSRDMDTICFEVPAGYPGQAPYAFYVTSGLRLKATGAVPQAYQEGASTPFGGSWGKFSWSHDNTWKPSADVSSGSNLANFVLSFADRLKEGA